VPGVPECIPFYPSVEGSSLSLEKARSWPVLSIELNHSNCGLSPNKRR